MILRAIGRYTVLSLLVLAVMLAAHAVAFAANPFGVGTPDSGGMPVTGPFGSLFMWVAMWQTKFYRLLTGALIDLKQSGHAFWLLSGVSFLYGIFHAAGPGHGKAVITSYLLVSRQTVRRGILISFAAALVQGVTAIAVVLIAFVVLKTTSIAMTKATDAFEIVSYALVTLVGAWLLWAKLAGRGHAHAHSHAHGATTGGHAHGGHYHRQGCNHEHHNHRDHGGGDHEDEHDHAHAPDPKFLSAGPLTISRAWSAILAVGIRPCSGAIIILVFALSQHLLYAGVASVVAMSLGTAITVSLLVVLAVSAKDLALRFAGADSPTAGRVVHALEIGAALFVFLFGVTLLGGALVGGSL